MAFSTIDCLFLSCLVAIAPRRRSTYHILASNACLVPVALCYVILLCDSWTPDTLSLVLPGSLKEGLSGGFKLQFLPSLQGISSLFSRATTAASLWLHLICINMFMGRSIYMEALQRNVPFRHSVLLSFLAGVTHESVEEGDAAAVYKGL
ncbi:hypothetical protein WJX73_008503 [Symbiochloris irregularis]|uniref:Uncharacterized protein n=1 Tax=Symbiochloris irregularis TaxID=706552 RepID=A0AAW1PCB3_9CHLO